MPGGAKPLQTRQASRMFYGSRVFSGQRFFAPTSDAFDPVAYGSTRTVGGAAPIPTVIPPSAMRQMGGMGGAYVEEGVPSGGGNHWSFTDSPLPILLILLVVGMFWLHLVHFSK